MYAQGGPTTLGVFYEYEGAEGTGAYYEFEPQEVFTPGPAIQSRRRGPLQRPRALFDCPRCRHAQRHPKGERPPLTAPFPLRVPGRRRQ